MVAELRQGDRALMIDGVEVTATAAQINEAGAAHAFVEAGGVAVAADVLAIPVTHRYVAKTTGGDAEALTLANGVPGQRLNIALVVDGGGTGTLTPATCSGFDTIVFADAGDIADLEYVDDTTGWILVGTAGIAAPPVTTLA